MAAGTTGRQHGGMKQRQTSRTTPSREPAAGHAAAPEAEAPRAQRQARQIASHFGPVAQRFLGTRNKRGDQVQPWEPASQKGSFNLYARRLADDRQVDVSGDEGETAGLTRRLKATAVDGATVRDELVSRLQAGRFWAELEDGSPLQTDLAAALELALQFGPDSGQTVAGYIAEQAPEFPDTTQEFLEGQLAALAEAASVGDVVACRVPLPWHDLLAEVLYDLTREQLIPKSSTVAPYLAPFKALIADVNNGNVDRFAYVEKWNRPNSGPGAEFTVDQPADLAEKYEGQAVLHTHYPSTAEAPHYAHTKPEAQKGQPGYGYTVVDLDEASKAAPVNKAHRDLP